MEQQQLETIKGSVIWEIFRGDGFGIVRVRPETVTAELAEFVAKGPIPSAEPEDVLQFTGEWFDDPKYGKQLKVATATRIIPTTIEGKQTYLAHHVKGVGKVLAANLVKHFGAAIIDILDEQPERLREVPGITEKKLAEIIACWHGEHDPVLRQLGLFLAQYEIPDSMAERVMNAFGKTAMQILTGNPYKLTRIDGIGFRTADKMAQRMGWPEQCIERTEAAFAYVINESVLGGHVFMTHDDLVRDVARVAGTRGEKATEDTMVEFSDVEDALVRVVKRGDIIPEKITIRTNGTKVVRTFYYLPRFYAAERGLAKRISELMAITNDVPPDVEETLKRVQENSQITLSDKQHQGILMALAHNMSVITGGPGCGKTTSTKALIETAERMELKVLLCAPTGRAAKRMSEVTNRGALTIHRLLEFNPHFGGFQRTHSNPLEGDLLIVDEASMLDVELAYDLLSAVPDQMSVVFIGDIDQLPSVGPGMVLRDLITSKRIPITRLDTIFRQAEGSLIVRNAHRIVRGEMPTFPPKGTTAECDSYLMKVPKVENDQGKMTDDINWVKTALPKVVRRLKDTMDLDPVRDIQVLMPMRKGNAGFPVFNTVLQQALNPAGEEMVIKGQSFRIGDRVMQLKNNYKDLDLSNGEIGFIKAFDIADQKLIIDFDGRDVKYPFQSTHELVLAYAATVHKAQGSEFRVVILIMLNQHWKMLERHLLYTANTRARKRVVYLSSEDAIKKAVETCDVIKRNSFLAHRLRLLIKDHSLTTAAAVN